jgi:hypothetical protein
MLYAPLAVSVGGMATSSLHPSAESSAPASANVFADLRRRNEHAARIGQLQDARRKSRIEQAIRAQRQQQSTKRVDH